MEAKELQICSIGTPQLHYCTTTSHRSNLQLLVPLSVRDAIEILSAGKVEDIDPVTILSTAEHHLADGPSIGFSRRVANMIYIYALCRPAALYLLKTHPLASISTIAKTSEYWCLHRRRMENRLNAITKFLTSWFELGFITKPRLFATWVSQTPPVIGRSLAVSEINNVTAEFLGVPFSHSLSPPGLFSNTSLIVVADFSKILELLHCDACDGVHIDSIYSGWVHGVPRWSPSQLNVNSLVLTYLVYRSIAKIAIRSKSQPIQSSEQPYSIRYAHVFHPAIDTRPSTTIEHELYILLQGGWFLRPRSFAAAALNLQESTRTKAFALQYIPTFEHVTKILGKAKDVSFSSLRRLILFLEEDCLVEKYVRDRYFRVNVMFKSHEYCGRHASEKNTRAFQQKKELRHKAIVQLLRDQMAKGYNPHSLRDVVATMSKVHRGYSINMWKDLFQRLHAAGHQEASPTPDTTLLNNILASSDPIASSNGAKEKRKCSLVTNTLLKDVESSSIELRGEAPYIHEMASEREAGTGRQRPAEPEDQRDDQDHMDFLRHMGNFAMHLGDDEGISQRSTEPSQKF